MAKSKTMKKIDPWQVWIDIHEGKHEARFRAAFDEYLKATKDRGIWPNSIEVDVFRAAIFIASSARVRLDDDFLRHEAWNFLCHMLMRPGITEGLLRVLQWIETSSGPLPIVNLRDACCFTEEMGLFGWRPAIAQLEMLDRVAMQPSLTEWIERDGRYIVQIEIARCFRKSETLKTGEIKEMVTDAGYGSSIEGGGLHYHLNQMLDLLENPSHGTWQLLPKFRKTE